MFVKSLKERLIRGSLFLYCKKLKNSKLEAASIEFDIYKIQFYLSRFRLRRSAANDNIFKLFSYIPFWRQLYITTQLKTNLIKGSVFFRYRLLNRQPIFNFENL